MIDVKIFQGLIKWILTVFFLFHFYSNYGQRARLFSTDTELSNSLIYDVLQDSKGIIWVATEDGLNKYDGSKVSIYKQQDKTEGSILHDFVHVIFEDSRKNLFFGFFNGLQIYDAAEDRFKEIPLLIDNVPFPAHVLTMLEQQDGSILVGTSGQGIFLLNIDKDVPDAQKIAGLVPSELINCLYEDNQQNLWISTQDKGLFRLRENDAQPDYFKSLGNNISSIRQDSEGNLYVGSLSKGLFRYDALNDTFVKLTPNLPVKVLLPTANNEILIGTDGEGIKMFNPETNTVDNLNFNISNFDLSKAKIHSMVEDASGNIWLGIFQKGVIVIPSRRNNFQYIGYQSVKNNIIGSSYVMSVLRDREGTLWVGTDGEGIYGISQNEQQIFHFTPSDLPHGVPATVMCMYEDSMGNFWVGSYLDGLGRLDRNTGAFFPVNNMLDNESNPARRIFSITEDKQKNLWIGTLGFGLFAMNLTTGEIKNYSDRPNAAHPNDATNTIHNSWINCLHVSGDDKLYIGTPDGIACLDLKTKTFSALKNKFPALSGEIVLTFHESKLGGLWIGSAHGLMYLNPEQTRIDTYTVKDGLPSNVICGIEEDEAQNLWISTNYGISKFNPAIGNFINYYYHDGLQGNEFSKRASFKDNSGTIFFGGINGITYFKPENIKDNARDLDVAITGFYLHNVAVKKGMKSGKYDIINTSVMDANTFHLSHDDNSFSIEFSSMEYVNPKRINYLYSMDGNYWISLQQGTNSVTFSDLEPGEYTFKVKAKDFATFSKTKEITIVIHPAWYFSTWAKAIYLLASLLILFGVFLYFRQRYRTRIKMREHLHTEQINQAKLEFFTNISHEIRTPLSLIINPLKKLIALDSDADRQKAYRVMRRNSERILHLVNQLMDLQKIEKGKIVLNFKETDIISFIKESCEIFEEQIQAKNIDFQVDSEPEVGTAWIDQDFFDKTLQNLVSNAIKFTPQGGKIRFFVEKDKTQQPSQQLKITVSDSGIGLNESEMEKIFDRFYQARGSKEHQHHAFGTGIGLHLTRSIVELHHGSIQAENNENGVGCHFIVRIPLGNKHLSSTEIQPGSASAEAEQNNLSTPAPLTETVENVPSKSKSKRWVLVVDDDEDIRNYISNELSSEYHTAECSNGKEALSWVLARKPDLVISDVVMPKMDGITLCRKVKQNVNINHIPVILLTAKSMEEDNLEGLSIGADAYIVKPFNIEILKKTVQNIIRNREILRNNYRGNQQQSDSIQQVSMKSPDEKLLKKITDVINENLGNTELNVEMLSREVGISRVHLHRKMKELTNQSTRDFIRNIRLQQAANLLSDRHMNISEVAFAVGFTNVAHFSNAFKEFFGESPTAYMEMHLKRQE